MRPGATRLRRWARSSTSLVGLVVLVGLVSSAGAGAVLAVDQRDNARQQLERHTILVAEEVANSAGRYVDTLRTVASAMGAFQPLTAATFADATRVLTDLGLPGATSIAFMVPATRAQIPAVQKFWRGRGVPGLTLTPAGFRAEHLFSVLSVPLDGATIPRIGIDLSQSAPATQALNEARRSGRTAISDPYHLLIDQRLPPDRRQQSFSLTTPVYGPPDAAGLRQFQGWVLMGLRGRDFMGAALTRASQDLVDVRLHAPRSDGTLPQVADRTTDLTGERDLFDRATIPVADRQWQVEVSAVGRSLPGGTTGMPRVVAVSGGILSLLLGGLVWLLATGRARAQARVRAATADLAAANVELGAVRDDLTMRKDYLTQVLDAIDVAVLTCDGEGLIVHANRTARRYLPPADPRAGVAAAVVDLRRPDGTPIPPAERPFERALNGEEVTGMEVLLDAPNGTRHMLMLHARPLRDPDGVVVGAVNASIDVTALREREAELHEFAGVVAHDLKAPLSVIAGYAELVHDGLTDGAPTPRLHAGLDRVRGGVERMRRLIDDLLTYAVARDAPLRTEVVDLQTLVADVVGERTAHLRGGAGGDGRPALFPDIYTGPLPAVHADPAMLRQLLDNLIGNALKYALPGQPARIDISAHPSNDHDGACCDDDVDWVRVQVADRGVGIPAEDRPNVFDTFHRAAAPAGDAGTGLGLAICRRVVHRHGGVITVADNPGGGTCITFTLPKADRRVSARAVSSTGSRRTLPGTAPRSGRGA